MRAPIVPAILLVFVFPGLTAGGLAGREVSAAARQAAADKTWPPAGVFRAGKDGSPGVIAPKLIKDVKPNYTAEAMRAKIAGRVVMEAVVGIDGTVGDVRVTKSLDREFGLDDQAVKALKQWRFEPGTKGGVPVPVLVVTEMSFSLRK